LLGRLRAILSNEAIVSVHQLKVLSAPRTVVEKFSRRLLMLDELAQLVRCSPLRPQKSK